ncbi:centriolar coiled-coil protein of 110 kDa-like [Conger conger]|uniref:centriolar coiled-coil protein of 110 kDa-like n=1 Tax=Conger conger TaxID=82655 RepID=UPI002A59AE28|nr:centriolar coiled-coil protein of 110 kDa-like [Conger conger]
MKSYEEFCFSSLARLQAQGKKKTSGETSGQQRALSLIHFHGRAVLSPVLSAEQRREMVQYRQRAVQLDAERQSLRRERLLTQGQDTLDGVQAVFVRPPPLSHRQVRQLPEEEKQTQAPPTRCSPQPEFPNGFTLPPWGGRGLGDTLCGTNRDGPQEKGPPVFQNGTTGDPGEERGEGGRQSPLREQGWGASRDSCRATPTDTLRESIADKSDSSGGRPQTTPASDHAHPGLDPLPSPNPQSGLASPHAQLPTPEPSVSPRPHRRRPRPVSTGNIFISFPVYAAEQERGMLGGWGPAGERSPPNHQSPANSLLPPGVVERRGSHCGADAGGETAVLTGARAPGPVTQDPRVATPGFRRRSQTLDSQPHPGVDRSQERVPRFMGGVPWRPPCRRSPTAPLNQTYDLESPVPALLLRAQGAPVRSPAPSPSPLPQPRETQPGHGATPHTGPADHTPGAAGEAQWEVHALEDMRRQMEEEHALQLSLLIAEQEKEQWRLQQELEERERRRREQAGKRASAGDLRAGWENQREGCSALSPAGPAQNLTGPALSPAGHTQNLTGPALSPADRSPGPVRSMGNPILLSRDTAKTLRPGAYSAQGTATQIELYFSRGFSEHSTLVMVMHCFSSALSPSAPPAAQSPVYLWGPSWGVGKARGRQSQVLTPELHAVLCRLTAVARGFLTRRLLQTEKVKHLRQTVQDTQEFICSFHTEAPLRRKGSVSAQDLSLQERVRAQLRAALYDVHDIFFEMPLEERLALLLQDRELRMERRLREMEKAKSPRDRVTLSAATQKSLDRKKQRVTGSPGQAKRIQQKPKSPPTNRVLQPNQGQNSPVPGQLLRQGSLYRKAPEERVRHSDSLRKQHSLG